MFHICLYLRMNQCQVMQLGCIRFPGDFFAVSCTRFSLSLSVADKNMLLWSESHYIELKLFFFVFDEIFTIGIMSYAIRHCIAGFVERVTSVMCQNVTHFLPVRTSYK
jgi:hypothetical protein